MPDFITGLVDKLGRPIQREVLTQPLARATMTGVRQPVGEGASRGLTPVRLAHILREALGDNPERYFELAEEMEEKDLHYTAVLGTRKRQVAQLDQTLIADAKDAQQKDIAAAVTEELIDSGVIDRFVFDMLDAVGKGFSVGEIMWQTSGNRWKPNEIEYVDPRFIRFDRATRRIPLLLEDSGQRIPLAPYKFIFTQIKAKSGIPIRGGIARLAAWAYLFKNFGLKDWVQFCEIYGIPFRLGKYPAGATNDDKEALLQAVAQIAVDAAGIIPQTMMIEFQEAANKGSSADLYKMLLEYLDDQMSKAVLGQTSTTNATPGKLGGGVEHTQVREDIERADAKAISAALNEQLIRPYVIFNFGPQAKFPWLNIGRPENKDAQLMVDAAAKLGGQMKIRAGDIRGAVGFTEPVEGDELLTAPQPPPNPFGNPGGNLSGGPHVAPGAGPVALAAAIAARQETQDAIDRAAQEAGAEWQTMMKRPADQIAALAARCTSFDEFQRELVKLYPGIDMSGLAHKLAVMTFQAAAAGYTGETL